jgi:hypothetical protein
MEKNKVMTYMLYAVGEIFLVVIGILIAVSLNNWNDKKKAQARERKTLLELKSALQADLKDIQFNIMWHQSAQQSCALLLKIMDDPIPYADSLGYHFGAMARFSQFIPDLSTYETIKSSGIGLISNDSLRIRIAKYYENEITFALGTEQINRSLLPFDMHLYRKHFFIKQIVQYAEPIDYDALMRDTMFKSYLYSTLSFRTSEVELYQEMEKSCSSLISLIDDELNN